MRILVVDDNRDAADALVLLLRLWGNEARAAYDGPSALHTADAFRPQVALLDLGLPAGMDGCAVARRFREVDGLSHCVLIALTGYGRDEDRRRCREAGFDYFLLKPCEFGELTGVLAHAGEPTMLGPAAP